MPYPYITKILTTYDNKSRSPQTDLRHHTIEFSRFARAQLSLFYFGFASINNEIIYSRPFGPRINNYWCLKSVCGDLDLLSVGRNNYKDLDPKLAVENHYTKIDQIMIITD